MFKLLFLSVWKKDNEKIHDEEWQSCLEDYNLLELNVEKLLVILNPKQFL